MENRLEIPLKVNVPPGDGPPIYPIVDELEHEEQVRTLAPPPQELVEDSAWGVVSEGPAVQAPAARLRIQFTWLLRVAFVPEIVRGSQM